VYSLNWFVISPALPSISSEGDFPSWTFGLVLVAFFAFTGLFQIPSGLVSNRLGSTKTFVLGLTILSVGNMLLVLSPNLGWVIFTRGISGLGSALFFASAGGVLLGLYPERPGLVMGLYNVAFAVGGGGGLIWGIIHEEYGWRFGMLLAGALGLLVAGLNYVIVRNVEVEGRFGLSDALTQFKDAEMMKVALAFTGSWGAYFAAGQLLPAYLQLDLGKNTAASGIDSAPLLFASILGGTSALAYDRTTRRKLLLVVTGFLSIFPIAIFDLNGGKYIFPAILVLGFFNEMSISMFYAYVNDRAPQSPAASLAVVNTVQILLGMLVLPLLSISAFFFSWTYAWLIVGTLPLIPLVLLVNSKI
jgi:MFS family permease